MADQALEAFKGPGIQDQLEEAADSAYTKLGLETDFLEVEDADILAQDRAQLSRLTYVVSLLRMLNYIRETPKGRNPEDMAARQAGLAFQYVRHAEGSNLKVLQLGRDVKDRELVQEIKELRSKIDNIAEAKARIQKQQAIVAEVLPVAEKPNGEGSARKDSSGKAPTKS